VNDLHERIAEVLGWSIADVRSFSLATLREMVREKSPKLHRQIGEVLASGAHLYEDVSSPRRIW